MISGPEGTVRVKALWSTLGGIFITFMVSAGGNLQARLGLRVYGQRWGESSHDDCGALAA